MWVSLICSYFFQFVVDAVLVIDQEKIYNQLKTKLPEKVQVLHLPKSGGVGTFVGCALSFDDFYFISQLTRGTS